MAPLALDAVAGCGGTLARLAGQGVRLYYVVVYNGGLPEERVRRACRILGVAGERLLYLGFAMAASAEPLCSHLRCILSDLAAQMDPDAVFLPSPHSLDPRDAWVAREGIQSFRGRTLLGYPTLSRASLPAGSEGVPFHFDQPHARAKLRAMRPRRLRPGLAPPPAAQSASEALELLEWQPRLSRVLGEPGQLRV